MPRPRALYLLLALMIVFTASAAVVRISPRLSRAIHRLIIATGARSSTTGVARVAYATTIDRIVVDPAAPVQVIPPAFFGLNVVAFWDSDPLSTTSARALRQTPIRTLRFPGGVVSDWYDWQDPYYKGWSKTSPAQAVAYGRSFGASAFVFGTDYKDNIGTVPGRGYAVNSPANAAAWVAANKASHVNALMEVGNEEDGVMHSKDDPAFAPYSAAFNRQARAMHRADPHVRVAGPVGTNEYYWWGLDGLGQFLAATGNRTGTGQVDAVSLHFYRGSSWYDARADAQYWLSADGPWINIQRMIRAHDTRQLPVYLTEWNAGSGDSNNAFNPTVGHALVVADMLGAFALSGVAGEDYFDLHGSTSWGLLYGTGDARPADTPTPAYYAQVLWGHMGHTVLRVDQNDDAATQTSVYATAGSAGSYQVLVINKQSSPRRVSIALDGATPRGRLLRTYTLRGTTGHHWDIEAIYDGVAQPAATQTLPGPSARRVTGNSIDATIPPYSAVVLAVNGTGRAPRLTPSAIPTSPTPALTTAGPSTPLTAAGFVSATRAMAGGAVSLSATVTANEDIGPALVDLELYDAIGAKVWQETEPVTLTTGQRVVVTKQWAIAATSYGGAYTFKLGIFTPGWGHTFAWVDNAGQINVSGPPPPVVSATGALAGTTGSVAHPGDTLDLTSRVSSERNGLAAALVDFEVYSMSGTKVCQQVVQPVTVPSGGTVSVSARCPLSVTTAAGTYVCKIGVFRADWGHLFAWNNSAVTFKVAQR